MRERIPYPKMIYGDYQPLGYKIVYTKEEHEAETALLQIKVSDPVHVRLDPEPVKRARKKKIMYTLDEVNNGD